MEKNEGKILKPKYKKKVAYPQIPNLLKEYFDLAQVSQVNPDREQSLTEALSYFLTFLLIKDDTPPNHYQEKPKKELPENSPHLMTVLGKPRSGKDLLAEIIQNNYLETHILTFSSLIMDEVNSFSSDLNFRIKITENNKAHYAARRVLQEWGQAKREEDPNWWAKKMVEKIKTVSSAEHRHNLIIITGTRSEEELDIFRGNAEVWKVIRPGYTDEKAYAHKAENLLDGLPDTFYDQIIVNEESSNFLEDYEQLVLNTVEKRWL